MVLSIYDLIRNCALFASAEHLELDIMWPQILSNYLQRKLENAKSVRYEQFYKFMGTLTLSLYII